MPANCQGCDSFCIADAHAKSFEPRSKRVGCVKNGRRSQSAAAHDAPREVAKPEPNSLPQRDGVSYTKARRVSGWSTTAQWLGRLAALMWQNS